MTHFDQCLAAVHIGMDLPPAFTIANLLGRGPRLRTYCSPATEPDDLTISFIVARK